MVVTGDKCKEFLIWYIFLVKDYLICDTMTLFSISIFCGLVENVGARL